MYVINRPCFSNYRSFNQTLYLLLEKRRISAMSGEPINATDRSLSLRPAASNASFAHANENQPSENSLHLPRLPVWILQRFIQRGHAKENTSQQINTIETDSSDQGKPSTRVNATQTITGLQKVNFKSSRK